VDTVGNDHPRLVALSHPLLHPAADARIRRYSQQFVDLIDLEENTLKTLPIEQVLDPRYSPLRYIAQLDEGGYLTTIRSSMIDASRLVVTFDELLRRTPFAGYMRTALKLIEETYRAPVDTEFTVQVVNPETIHPTVKISLLQCRPQSQIEEGDEASIPAELPEKDIIFSTRRMVPHGAVKGIHYVLFVKPDNYFGLPSQAERTRLERAIGQLNLALKDQTFICVGPGRWGTSTPDLGVHVAYGDIYNTRALIELSGQSVGTSPEPSFGTHFFQDLMEAKIYPLAVYLDDRDAVFAHDFFYSTPNRVGQWISADETTCACLHLIAVNDYRPGHYLTLVMDDDDGRAVCFLEKDR
jgi:hypothetical protein